MLECWGVGWAIFVFRCLYFFAGFVGRNNPVKPAVFGHGAEEEVCIAGHNRESSAEKITCGDGIGFLRFAFLNLFNHFVDVRVGRTQTGDCRRILLDQAEERDVRQIGRYADFDNGFRLMLFRRVKLGEAGPQNMGLQIVSAGCGTLFHLIFH